MGKFKKFIFLLLGTGTFFMSSAVAAMPSLDLSLSLPILLFITVFVLAGIVAGIWLCVHHYSRLRRLIKTYGEVLEKAPSLWLVVRKKEEAYEIIDQSPRISEILNLPKRLQLKGNKFLAIFTKPSRQLLQQHIETAYFTFKPFKCEIMTFNGLQIFEITGEFLEGNHTHLILWGRQLTAKKKLDHTLSDLEVVQQRVSLYENIIDALPIPIWSRDENLRINYCNKAYEKALNISKEEIIAENVEIAPIGAFSEEASLAQRVLDENTQLQEQRRAVIDGSRRFLEVTEYPLEDVEGLGGYIIDKTDVAELKSDLSRHMRAHGEVLELMSTGIAVYGPDQRLKFFNQSYKTFCKNVDINWLHSGPTLSEVLEDLRMRRLLPEVVDFPAFKREELKQFTSLTHSTEELYHLPDGRTFRKVTAPHPLGGIIYLYENVTDALSLERRYNALSAVQQATINHLYEGVAVFGSDGLLKLKNTAFDKIWQIDPGQDIVGQHASHLIEKFRDFFACSDEEWPDFKEVILREATDRSAKTSQLELSDGRILRFSYVPLPDGAHLLMYLDITDRAHVERVLRERNEVLETADHLKSDFIENITYELRAPLNTIIGFSDMLKHNMFGKMNEKQEEYVSAIFLCSKQLLTLVGDIIDLATIDSGKMKLEVSTFDVKDFLDHTVSLVHQRALQKNLRVEAHCESGVRQYRGDKKRLMQALFNLLNNAISYTKEGGIIELRARVTAQSISFLVLDNGVGVNPEDQNKLYQKFNQQSRIKIPKSGATLGFSLIKRLIKLHGGKISIKSKKGEGTAVECKLPLEYTFVENSQEVA